MNAIDVNLRVGNEMNLLCSEVQELHREVRDDNTSPRFAYVDAQFGCSLRIMEAMMACFEDLKWFPAFLELQRRQALSEYKKAKNEKNQEKRIGILGQLRFMATLARRIADPRRPMLFRSESPWSVASEEEERWHRELVRLLADVLANLKRVEPLGNEPRRLMALAQVFLGNEMSKQFLLVGDCSDFRETVYDYIDSETERYNAARFAGDRKSAQVMLARVRFAKTLARRLDRPRHEPAWFDQGSQTKH